MFGPDTATSGLAASIQSTLDENECATSPCTKTLALLPGSPAVDAYTGCVAATTDQRGMQRSAEHVTPEPLSSVTLMATLMALEGYSVTAPTAMTAIQRYIPALLRFRTTASMTIVWTGI